MTNCRWPSPVVGGWETQTRLVDVIFRALLPALPERLPAGTKAMMCHAGFGGIDLVTGSYYCFLETFGGGYGGRAASDGPDAVQAHGQNTENAPVEETELNYPVRVPRLSLVEDSDGAGRFRGGLGLRKDYLFDRPTTFTVLADRTVRRLGRRVRRVGTAGPPSTCSCAGARSGACRPRGRSSSRRATSSATAPAAAAGMARRASAIPSSSAATCARGRCRPGGPARSTG